MSVEAKSQIRESSENLSDIQDQLYNSVVSGDFDKALKLTKDLVNKNGAKLIKNVVESLLNNGNHNVNGYGYILWLANEQSLVIGYFPPVFKMIFNGDIVTITDVCYGLPLKLNDVTERDGDRKAYGDGRKMVYDAMRWTFKPIWENNTLYFKVLNEEYKQWLKLVMKAEDRGDRRAFGSDDDDTQRHEWCLHPVTYKDRLFFYFFNRQFDMALYLGDWLGANDDRIAWGLNGRVLGQPALYGWQIK